jgi:hypothetical protein
MIEHLNRHFSTSIIDLDRDIFD